MITLREASVLFEQRAFGLLHPDADAFTVDVGRDRARPSKFRVNKLNSA